MALCKDLIVAALSPCITIYAARNILALVVLLVSVSCELVDAIDYVQRVYTDCAVRGSSSKQADKKKNKYEY